MEGRRDLADVFNLLMICGILSGSHGNSRLILNVFQSCRAVLSVTGFIMSLASVYNTGIKDSLSRYAFFCAAGFFLSVQAVSFWLNRQLIEQTFVSIKRLNEKRIEPRQIDNFRNISIKVWLGINIFIYSCLFFNLVYFVFPLGYDIYLSLFTNSTEPYGLPLPNKFIAGTEPPTRSFSYYSVTLFIIIWVGNLCFTAVGYYATIFFLILYICNEFTILSENILNWGNLCNKYNHGNEAKLTLKMIVQDHQEVTRLGPALREILGIPFMAHSVVCPMSLTLFLYTVKMSLKIFESLCSIPWYEMSPNMRKELNMIVRQAVRPITIHYKGRYFINLRTFMQILNSCYSYFMLLNSMN
ncbi:uncharacterized protein isoform X1 [Rhodnius prolixus]|uniref:uncharacterized protein isoform X1 n=1 Tax=Rhodnius prolixus TaxID=13249 RepID=UPI003D18A675